MAANKNIFVNIQVSSKKAKKDIDDVEKGVDKLAAAEKRLAFEQSEEAKELAKLNLKIKEHRDANILAAQSADDLGNSTKRAKTQVGLNNAILTEAGRAASDLRFGFNGVANNVGQLASLFGNLIQTSDSVGTSLRNLFKSLMGTGGILIAIQLLIAYGDQIYNFFLGIDEGAEKARKSIEEATKAMEDQIRVAQNLAGTNGSAFDFFAPDDDVIKNVERLKDRFDDFKNGYDKLDESSKTNRVSLGLLIDDYFNYQKQQKELIRLEQELKNTQKQDPNQRSGGLERLKELELLREQLRTQFDLVKSLKPQWEALNKERSGGANRDPKVFEQKLLQLEKIEQNYREKAINNDLKTNEERIDIFEENELAKLDITIKNFIERRALTLKNYKEDINNLNISEEEKLKLIKDAEKKHTQEVTKANNDRAKVKEQIEAVGDLKLKRLIDKEAQIRRASSLREVETLKFSLGNNQAYYEAKTALLKKNIEAEEELVNSFAEGTAERANAEAKLFKTRDLLVKNELQQEVAAIEEKTRVQQEYVGYVSGISGVLKTLAGENEALQKAALVLEKGAAIAGIVIGANKSIANSVANTAAANTAASIMMSTPGLQAAGLAAIARNEVSLAKEVLMTKVSAGIGIASILATSLTSAKSSSVGGGTGAGAGVTVQAPEFNVVGASSTDQLAQAVGGQVNEPIRAYVVGSEVTNQQELDRRIVDTAGIG